MLEMPDMKHDYLLLTAETTLECVQPEKHLLWISGPPGACFKFGVPRNCLYTILNKLMYNSCSGLTGLFSFKPSNVLIIQQSLGDALVMLHVPRQLLLETITLSVMRSPARLCYASFKGPHSIQNPLS